jgi:molybdopterin molybdotransferase
MQEHVDRSGPDVLIRRAARSRENVIERGEDVRTGDLVLGRGRRLRPADLGILAGLGLPHVRVALPPRVAILATGDEVVGPGDSLVPGQVRDMNSAALAGAVLAAGGVPRLHGVVRDERGPVDEALRGAKKASEMVLISGGSSVGERDVVAEAIAAMGPPGIIVHGIAMRPGKPTVLAASGTVPVIGLPGNPVSALVIFDVFARPVIEGLLEMDPALRRWGVLRARLTAGLPGAGEREDHRRVRLEARSGGIWAIPLAAGSQVLTSLVRGDGIVVVAPGARYEEGDEVEVKLLQ